MIRGVIFDMDGLMTDTERLFQRLWCEEMHRRGMPENREVVAHCIGMDHKKAEEYVAGILGADFPYQEIMRCIGTAATSYCEKNGVPVKPGLYTLLDYLDKQSIPYAVATSTAHDRAVRRLDNIGVLSRLSGLVTGDEVRQGKPAPEIFLRAAEKLNLPPEDCLVLEDSPHGILAASRAGCLPFMIPDLQQPDAETEKLLYGRAECLDQVIPVLKD